MRGGISVLQPFGLHNLIVPFLYQIKEKKYFLVTICSLEVFQNHIISDLLSICLLLEIVSNIKLCAIQFCHQLLVSVHRVGNNTASTVSYKNIRAALVVVVVVAVVDIDVVVVICCHFRSRWLLPQLWLCTLMLPPAIHL